MFVAGAGKGHFEVTGWIVSQSKAIKLVHLDGLDSSKLRFESTVLKLKNPKCHKFLQKNRNKVLFIAPIRLVVPNRDEELINVMCASETGIKVWNIQDLDPKLKETRPMIGQLAHPNLPETNQVDALAQYDNELMVSKCSNSGVIFLWRHKDLLAELQDGQT